MCHKTKYRVIYADTDKMGFAYHANYFRWFEIGRSEMFRDMGLPYKTIEEKGYFLPLSEAHCKFISSARYDDIIVIETSVDTSIKGGMKFDYRIFSEDGTDILAEGYTKHAFVNQEGRVVRPPEFLKRMLK
ncbi:MAG: acyl-CoA thioesterase [Desulfobacterales bacterium]|nr:acyl-CoA thioesterase [Desulfobacterales bacterium]